MLQDFIFGDLQWLKPLYRESAKIRGHMLSLITSFKLVWTVGKLEILVIFYGVKYRHTCHKEMVISDWCIFECYH